MEHRASSWYVVMIVFLGIEVAQKSDGNALRSFLSTLFGRCIFPAGTELLYLCSSIISSFFPIETMGIPRPLFLPKHDTYLEMPTFFGESPRKTEEGVRQGLRLLGLPSEPL